MDGTLVETEEYWGEAMFELAGQLGGRMSAEARAATVGTSMRVAMDILYADLGVTRTEEQTRADVEQIMDAVARRMSERLIWLPGAQELLAAVHEAGLRTALVTTTPRRLADLVITHIEAAFADGPFDVTVCGDEVPARKPDPAPYLQAMAALGVSPGESVVIEDSLVGVTSGLAAGAAVLGVAGLQAVSPASGLVQVDSLAGIGLPELSDVLAHRRLAESAAR
ncbi:haloacid dehalogenase superfamily, subfamily IA, variant 3 with third motif having DD or ED [Blastococcus aurantiacus]|uniref:Haloacid dehalogenase superfamily, subfamily IA, variant 3 with third motif having DD or ED n=2 Tax=Blastococcus aurantiacus TaxID=1550231 RepID=A0A1G7RBR5_9ACTN|nr:haloacid dehalogenase superfamily, subfamily IA, variant 3 with third motif having DD or ED [Blastococcus aurantiacus]